MARSSKKRKKRVRWDFLLGFVVIVAAALVLLKPSEKKTPLTSLPLPEEAETIQEPPQEKNPVTEKVRDEIAESGPIHSAAPEDNPFFLIKDGKLEDAWDQEVKKHLLAIDANEAEKVFQKYMDERQSYRFPLEADLTKALRDLSQLNSSEHHKQNTSKVDADHEGHFQSLRWVFGPHYNIIEREREIFLQNHLLTGSSAP